MTSYKQGAILFKGDGDQDRPSLKSVAKEKQSVNNLTIVMYHYVRDLRTQDFLVLRA